MQPTDPAPVQAPKRAGAVPDQVPTCKDVNLCMRYRVCYHPVRMRTCERDVSYRATKQRSVVSCNPHQRPRSPTSSLRPMGRKVHAVPVMLHGLDGIGMQQV